MFVEESNQIQSWRKRFTYRRTINIPVLVVVLFSLTIEPSTSFASNSRSTSTQVFVDDTMILSQCSCGGIQLRISRISSTNQVVACHCRHCRRYHVTAFTNYVIVPSMNDILFSKGFHNNEDPTRKDDSDKIRIYHDTCDELGPVERWQCRDCYSKLLTRPRSNVVNQDNTEGSSLNNNELVLINMGPLDDDSIPKKYCEQWKYTMTHWHISQSTCWVDAVATRQNRYQSQVGSMPPKTLMVKGGCACGTYRYQFPFHPRPVGELQHCYCKLCRKLSGGPFCTWIPVRKDELEWIESSSTDTTTTTNTKGEPTFIRTTTFGRRHVCTKCASVLTIVYDSQPELIWPAAGSLNDDCLPTTTKLFNPYLGRVIHICCRWKQAWYDIPNDNMPQLDNAC